MGKPCALSRRATVLEDGEGLERLPEGTRDGRDRWAGESGTEARRNWGTKGRADLEGLLGEAEGLAQCETQAGINCKETVHKSD